MSTHGEAAREAERQHFVLVVERIRKLEKELVSVYDDMRSAVKKMDEREGVDVNIRITPPLAAAFKMLETERAEIESPLPSILRGNADPA